MDIQLDALVRLHIEFLENLFLFGDLCKQLKANFDQILLDHTEELVLLERFPRKVERQVLGIDDSLDKAQPLRQRELQFLTQGGECCRWPA